MYSLTIYNFTCRSYGGILQNDLIYFIQVMLFNIEQTTFKLLNVHFFLQLFASFALHIFPIFGYSHKVKIFKLSMYYMPFTCV